MAGVAKWISQLKDIRSGLNALNKPNFSSILGSLDRIINFLENYLDEEKYHKPASKDEQDKTKERIRKKLNGNEDRVRQNPKKKLDATLDRPDCGIGKHWVRRAKKNGEPGFCRSNPRRNSRG